MQRGSAFASKFDRADGAAGFPLDDTNGRAGLPVNPLVAPLHERHDDWKQVAAHFGQAVNLRIAPSVCGGPGHHPRLNEFRQTFTQDVLGDPEAVFEIAESLGSEKRLPNDQKRPPLSDQLKGAGDRADLGWKGCVPHISIMTHLVSLRNHSYLVS